MGHSMISLSFKENYYLIMSEPYRLVLTDKQEKILSGLAHIMDTNRADVIARAVALLEMVKKHPDNRVILRNDNTKTLMEITNI